MEQIFNKDEFIAYLKNNCKRINDLKKEIIIKKIKKLYCGDNCEDKKKNMIVDKIIKCIINRDNKDREGTYSEIVTNDGGEISSKMYEEAACLYNFYSFLLINQGNKFNDIIIKCLNTIDSSEIVSSDNNKLEETLLDFLENIAYKTSIAIIIIDKEYWSEKLLDYIKDKRKECLLRSNIPTEIVVIVSNNSINNFKEIHSSYVSIWITE